MRSFAREERVVVEQHGVWRSVETDETIGEAGVASVFRVADGRVSYYARYDTLGEALDAAGLGVADESGP